jgi:hypothetical protein
MKRISIVLLLIMGLIVPAGCGEKPNNQITTPPGNTQPGTNVVVDTPPGQFYPLTVGSTWEYEGAGNEFASFTRKVVFAQGNLAQTSEDNGGTVTTRIVQTNENAVTVVYFSGEDYQPQNKLADGFTSNENDILLQAPVKVGTTWASKNANKSIVSITESIDTPAGKFDNCVKVKFTGQNDTIYQYYKSGVGLVKQEFISGNTAITSTLKKYDIK